MSDIRHIRLYQPTKDRFLAICRETGMDMKRAIAAFVEGWRELPPAAQATAIANSISEPAEGRSHPIRTDTHEQLQALVATHTGPQARMVDALVNGWDMLDHEQRRLAIVASAPGTPPLPEDAATPGSIT